MAGNFFATHPMAGYNQFVARAIFRNDHLLEHQLFFSYDPCFGDHPFFANAIFCWNSVPDWRRGCITRIMHQGDTNCCWAVVTRDALYALQFLLEGRAIRGSVQDLLDFVHLPFPPDDALYDVAGRLMIDHRGLGNSFHHALTYVMRFGVIIEDELPFLRWCRNLEWIDRPFGDRIFLHGYGHIDELDYEEVERRLRIQPLMAEIASPPSFEEWEPESGVYLGFQPDEVSLISDTWALNGTYPYYTHAILVVGYGVEYRVENGIPYSIPYYLAKNSWGELWGFWGYVKIARTFFDGMGGFYFPEQPYMAVA